MKKKCTIEEESRAVNNIKLKLQGETEIRNSRRNCRNIGAGLIALQLSKQMTQSMLYTY